MFFPKRKSTRIPGYDYASSHAYFVTICTKEKRCLFGKPNQLNSFGETARDFLLEIPKIYPQVMVDNCVVMPNHIHAIFVLGCEKRDEHVPDLTRIVGQYKMSVTKEIHKTSPELEVWQRSFHDHVIRDQRGYEKIWEYIAYNPVKWEEDCFYSSDSGR